MKERILHENSPSFYTSVRHLQHRRQYAPRMGRDS